MTFCDFTRSSIRDCAKITIVNKSGSILFEGEAWNAPPEYLRAELVGVSGVGNNGDLIFTVGCPRYPFGTETLKRAFRECKKVAGLDFARTNAAALGDCNSCCWAAINEKHGEESRGIFLKHWQHGMNGSGEIEEQDCLFIAHRLTEEQAAKVLAVLGRYFVLESTEYDKDKCFVLLGQKVGV